MNLKTRTLSAKALSFAVALVEGYQVVHVASNRVNDKTTMFRRQEGVTRFEKLDYARDQALAGEIIDRERISASCNHSGVWRAWNECNLVDEQRYMCSGTTRLEAAMRCYLLAQRGETIEMNIHPDDLAA